jgi:hypothetical protein
MSDIIKQTGVVHKVLPAENVELRDGSSKQKQVVIINFKQAGSQYDDFLALEEFGDEVTLCNSVSVGQEVVVEYRVQRREHAATGRWYTSVKLRAITLVTQGAGQPAQGQPNPFN